MMKYKETYLLVLIAYTFSVLVRLIWVYQFQGYDPFLWNGQLMINTNDGYYFAENARDIIDGVKPYAFDNNGILASITAFLYNVLPLKFETLILYLPSFFGSLLVIPLILIGVSLNQKYMGFIAAIIGSIVWSYYNRTMTGYYDTDMLNIVTPMFVLWSIVYALITQKNRYLVLMLFLIVISAWWYPKNIALNTAMLFMGVVYVIVKDRHNLFNLKLIAFGLIGLSLLPIFIKIVFAIVLFLLFHYKEALSKKYIYYILFGLAIFYFTSGAFHSIWSSFNLYVIHRFFPNHEISNIAQLQFYDVIKTVREASAIPFETFANRISGHTITFLVSTIGIGLMLIRYPVMIISLPMIAMGYMAYKSGLRFTVYAVPIYALGFGYIVMYVISFLKDKFIQMLLATSMVCLALYPNIKHIIGYKVPTVLSKAEVKDLNQLKTISTPKDYTLAWWDYGYPIRYYSYTKTLIDGGKHNHDNYIISKILQTTSPELAANLSRLAVEAYVDSNYSVVADILFKEGKKNKVEPDLLLTELEDGSYVLPQKTRDIYLYLPYKMFNIFPTVSIFGNLNLKTGKAGRKFTFYPTFLAQKSKEIFKFRNGIVFDIQKGLIQLGKQRVDVKYFIVTQNTQDGKIQLQSQLYHAGGDFVVIYMKSYNRFVVMDTETFKSMYVQMFILGKYDKKLFELVVSSPYSKIYKLKI